MKHQPLAVTPLRIHRDSSLTVDLSSFAFVNTTPSRLGSVLANEVSRRVVPEWIKPTFEDVVLIAYTPGPPRYSPTFFQRANNILINRDAEVSRLERIHTARAATFRAKQDQELLRNPSRHVAKQLPYDRSLASFQTSSLSTIGPYSIVSFVSLVDNWIENRAIAAVYKSVLQNVKRHTRGRKR